MTSICYNISHMKRILFYLNLILLILLSATFLLSCSPETSVIHSPTISPTTPFTTPFPDPNYQDAELTSREWLVMSINGKAFASGYPTEVAGINDIITIKFNKSGSFTGVNLCNYYGGNYAVSGDTITFSNVTMTLLGCPSNNNVADDYLQLFSNSVSYKIIHNKLSFLDKDGNELVVFKLK